MGMTPIAAPIGFTNVRNDRVGMVMGDLERRSQRILGLDRQNFGSSRQLEADDVLGRDIPPSGDYDSVLPTRFELGLRVIRVIGGKRCDRALNAIQHALFSPHHPLVLRGG